MIVKRSTLTNRQVMQLWKLPSTGATDFLRCEICTPSTVRGSRLVFLLSSQVEVREARDLMAACA